MLGIFCVRAWETLVEVLEAGRKENIESAVTGAHTNWRSVSRTNAKTMDRLGGVAKNGLI